MKGDGIVPEVCGDCGGTGLILVEDAGGLTARRCRCLKERSKFLRWSASGLFEKRFEGMRLDNYQPQNSYQRAALEGLLDYVRLFEEIRKHRYNSVLLIGDVGVGKTHLLVGAGKALLEKGYEVIFVNTVELIEKLREAELNKTNPLYDGESIRSQIETLSNTEVVIFDDVGKEKVTEWVQVQYYRLINRRYIAMLPTLFSSNLDIKELSQEIGSTVASRMVEMSAGRIYPIVGKNQRLSFARKVGLEG